MPLSLKKIEAVFYCNASGAEPVREWLKALPVADKRVVGFDIATAEYAWPVGMSLCKALGGGLWEVRSNLPSQRIARVVFCVLGGHMVLLHGFIKKTQKMPQSDLDLAKKRYNEVKRSWHRKKTNI